MSRAYYNDSEPYVCEWLRNLIAAGLIAPGDVDERSIKDVQAKDLDGYTQCHFFAGIGGWSLALRLAGWPDDRPVWTGSCPCQPFSTAGKQRGTDDERHLWPDFCRLISECRPATVFGEQVASPSGRRWLAGVRGGLEALGYGVGAADLCAAGIGAPHIRQRLWWVADAESSKRQWIGTEPGRQQNRFADGGRDGHGLGQPDMPGLVARRETTAPSRYGCATEPAGGDGRGLGDAQRPRLERHAANVAQGGQPRWVNPPTDGSCDATSWGDYDIVRCLEPTKEPGRLVEKWRRIEPGTPPLAHGVSGRVGRIRAYGNAIVPQVAAWFIGAFMDIQESEVAA